MSKNATKKTWKKIDVSSASNLKNELNCWIWTSFVQSKVVRSTCIYFPEINCFNLVWFSWTWYLSLTRGFSVNLKIEFLHFYFKLWKIIVNMILQKYSALQTYFFFKKSCGFENLMRRFSILHYYFIIYCRNPQVHPQRIGLQRRLYWIYLGYFLKFLVLCNCKLMSILFRSFNISFIL